MKLNSNIKLRQKEIINKGIIYYYYKRLLIIQLFQYDIKLRRRTLKLIRNTNIKI